MRAIHEFWKFEKIEHAFLAIAGIFGCLLIWITPPFQVADEYLHFYRAFQIAEGQWIAQQQVGDCYGYSQYFENTTCLGGKLPKSLLKTVRESSRVDLRFHPERKQNFRDIFAVSKIPLNPDDRLFIKFNTTGLHAPIPYFPQSVGIAIGKTLNLSPLLIFYLGRFTNLAVWLMLSGMALKITPIGKLFFGLLLLTPMSLFQASSLSADAVTNGLAFLWIAIVFKLIFDRQTPLKIPDLIYLSILSPILCLAKLAYFPLLFLLFLIPIDRIKTRTRYYITLAGIWITSGSAILIWSSIVDRIYVPLSAGILPDRQIEFILNNPLEFTTTILRTFSQEGLDYLHQFIGVLGWVDTPLPGFHVGSYVLILILVAFWSRDSEIVISAKPKLAIAAILVLNMIVLSTLAYLWNPIGAKIIGGLQGRYFIPLSPLFFILFYHNKQNFKYPKILQTIVCYYLFFSGTTTLAILIHRYYI